LILVEASMDKYSIQKILVPVDLSETSLNALETAVHLAKKHRAALQVLNVTEQAVSETDQHKFKNSYHPDADVLIALTSSISHLQDIESGLIRKKGNVVETIIATAAEEQSDLIVIGTHGASGFRDGYIGSNAYNVIKHAACPVLSIPPKKKVTAFHKALFPIRAAPGALKYYNVACHFIQSGSLLQVLGLSYLTMEKTGVLDKLIDEIREQLDSDKITTSVAWANGSAISENIFHYAKYNHTELVVLTSAIDAITKPNYIGPHTQRLINTCHLPLLSIKLKATPAFA
jgi:nucleotide-binding universal stress UspA family protein